MPVPTAPKNLTLSRITQTTMYVTFSSTGTSSTPITGRRISWGLLPSAGDHPVPSDGSTTLTNLPAGQKIYVTASLRNDSGWGPWCPIKSATLIAGAYVFVGGQRHVTPYVPGVWKRAVPYRNVNGVWKVISPRIRIFGSWKGTG